MTTPKDIPNKEESVVRVEGFANPEVNFKNKGWTPLFDEPMSEKYRPATLFISTTGEPLRVLTLEEVRAILKKVLLVRGYSQEHIDEAAKHGIQL